MSQKKSLLARLWDGVGRPRTLVCLAIFVYSFFDPHLKSRNFVWSLIAIYLVVNFGLRMIGSKYLFLKRVRLIFAVLDVVFISLIILNSTGPANSWFLLYLLPILSVSRYMGRGGILALAGWSVIGYTLVYWFSPEVDKIDLHSFFIRCVLFLGASGVAVNVARTRHRELYNLIKVHEQIARKILTESNLDQILKLILNKGLEFTKSEAGHIRLLNEQTGRHETITAIGDSENQNWSSSRLADEYANEAVRTGEEILVDQIPENRNGFFGYFRPQPKPQSALFVPLGSSQRVLAVIAVYSNWSKHYGEIDIKRLRAFAPLIESADRLRRVTEAGLYYKELIEQAPDPIIVLDKHGKIVVFNQACRDLWGYTKEEVEERPDVEIYYESREYAKDIARQIKESPGYRKEIPDARIKAKNGEIIPISLSASFVKKGEKFDRSIGVFKDQRHAIGMHDKLLQAERLAVVGELASKMGHDIKHNIATALNYLSILQFDCDPEQQPILHRDYSIIIKALNDSVAEFDKLLTAHQPSMPQTEELMICDLFRRVVPRTRLQTSDKNIRFVITYPEPDIKLSVDPQQIESVIANLFTNSMHAIKRRQETDASFSQGVIELSAQLNKKHVELVLKDNGCGIAPEDRQHIFNAFVTTKGDKGTGLGLYIVKLIVENHEGQIQLESEVGKGATFHIILPCESQ